MQILVIKKWYAGVNGIFSSLLYLASKKIPEEPNRALLLLYLFVGRENSVNIQSYGVFLGSVISCLFA